MTLCECCQEREADQVLSTSMPYSAAYCYRCATLALDPYFILVANTACCGGLENTIPSWQRQVARCLKFYGKDRETFDADVAKAMQDIESSYVEGDGTNSEQTG